MLRTILAAILALASIAVPHTTVRSNGAEELACPEAAATADVRRDEEAIKVIWPYQVFVPNIAAGEAVEHEPDPEPDAAFVELAHRLGAIIDRASTPGRFAIAVTDLQTNQTVGVNLDRQQLAGCVMNLFAIVATLQAVDEGRIELADVDATIRQTIWASDATAARELFRATGGGDTVAGVAIVNALLGELGMASSQVDHPPAFTHESIGLGPDNLVTARDVNHGLAQIYARQAFSPGLTGYLIEAMTNVKPGLNYLTAVVNGPAVVSHKNGFLWASDGYVDNDAAIVRFGANLEYAYAITFLSEGVPVKYADIPTGQELIWETWAYFDERYN